MWWYLFHYSTAKFREGLNRKALIKFWCEYWWFLIHRCDKCGFLLDGDKCNILDSLPDLEKKLLSDVIMTLIYIAGCVGRNDDEIHDTCFY